MGNICDHLVHRDAAENSARLTCNQDLGATAPGTQITITIARSESSYAHRSGSNETCAVTQRRPFADLLHQTDAALPGQSGPYLCLQRRSDGPLSRRHHAIHQKPGPDSVEDTALLQKQGRAIVGVDIVEFLSRLQQRLEQLLKLP